MNIISKSSFGGIHMISPEIEDFSFEESSIAAPRRCFQLWSAQLEGVSSSKPLETLKLS